MKTKSIKYLNNYADILIKNEINDKLYKNIMKVKRGDINMEKVKQFFKDKYNIAFIVILVIAILVVSI